jgi:hypothetical protein
VNLTNVGSTQRTYALSASATSLSGDSGNVSLNRSSVTLSPGETATVALDVTTDTPDGTYSGRIDVGGEYTAAFGYDVFSQHTLTVEKLGVNDTTVDGDSVVLVDHDSGQSRTVAVGSTAPADEGSVSFGVQAGTYTLYSGGTDESSGSPVIVGRTVSVSGDRTVTLDEGATVKYRLDTSEPESAHGDIETLQVVARLGTDTGGSNPYYQMTRAFPESGVVRFSTTANHDASVAHLLAPASDYPNEERHVDTSALYHLLHTTQGVDGAETFVVDRSSLGRQNVTYYRAGGGQTYDVVREVTDGSLARAFTTGEWTTRDRTNGTVYV